MMKRIVFLIFLLLPIRSFAEPATTILIDDFEDGLSPDWTVESFVGETDYQVVEENGSHVLAATSKGTASGLFFEKEIDLATYPILSWRWKIDQTVPGGDVRSKEKDDYPARVYVVFPHWFFPKTRSINYIWANRLPAGEIVPSPYTANSQMVAVRSGGDAAGKWQSERRNVYADYRRIFGEEPRLVGAIAIMTDSDNTGTSARAWYDDLQLSKESSGD
ncbi:MAG: hypothetical protein C0623_02525 [Desulfuromonas sp.]|nr:MAG: hypothetical protein C0623_02525 [Desulfuromonas sp.]